MNPGYYWHEFWWNTSAVYRSADIQGVSGPTGLAEWNRPPSFTINGYSNFGYFQLGGWYFPNDSVAHLEINGYHDFTNWGGTSDGTETGGPHGGVNVQFAGACTPGANNPNPQTVTMRGMTTNQTASVSLVLGTFDPSRCGSVWVRGN